ncbi:hypothetical protein [Rodentibacter myodis]|nr:hypothetical protein [Rodentibacter myodis]
MDKQALESELNNDNNNDDTEDKTVEVNNSDYDTLDEMDGK